MFNKNQRLGTTLFSLGLIALLFMSVVGLPHLGMSTSMEADGNMTMTDCYMPGMTTLCNMSPLEHIASWQAMFTSITTKSFTLSLFLLVLAAVVGFIWIKQVHSPPRELRSSTLLLGRGYIPSATPLQELFSSGILNPKLF